MTPLQAAYESLQGRFLAAFSFVEFEKFAADWEVTPVRVRGELVGAILKRGPEIHACIKPEGFRRWFNKSAKALLDGTIERYGYAITRVMNGNTVGMEFVSRLGFEPVGREGDVIIYKKV
jgi:hypothetical protein